MSDYVNKIINQAKQSSYLLAQLTTRQKNNALKNMSKAIMDNREFIIKENEKDIKKAVKNNLKANLIDRLKLTDKRLKEMSVSLKEVSFLPDPVGKVISDYQKSNGIRIKKVRVPLGVVLIVYEARPNVTADCAGLLFKTSNVGILRGGRNAVCSNKAIGLVLKKALKLSGINFPVFFVVEKTDRKIIHELLKADEYIDLVIPRGGESLIRTVVENSRIPVIKHYKGVCHIFVDKSANIRKALKICINAKTQRPSVCNAAETILVHKEIAREFIPALMKEFDSSGVIVRACNQARKIIPQAEKATEEDWFAEYLDLIVAIKIVSNIKAAVKHINTYGSHHTDTIITENKDNAKTFTREIDSACCFVNISTRFSDGFQFGLGAEIGISTDKLHARGPMGLEELTTYKWVATGNGQVRD